MSKIIVANWKMNPASQKEVEILFNKSITASKNIKNIKLIICPPFPFIYLLKKFKNSQVILGAQNVSKEALGSYTGEVSPIMLKNMGVSYVIVGHGECRKRGETNNIINEKILNLLEYKLLPILCVGESSRDRDGFYLSFVGDQIKEGLTKVSRAQMKSIIIAYEPIWAIGKNATREATKEEFMEMKIFIKKIISDIYGSKIAHSTQIIYGGSVNPLNTKLFLQEGVADGLLIGRDSIDPKKFSAILNNIN